MSKVRFSVENDATGRETEELLAVLTKADMAHDVTKELKPTDGQKMTGGILEAFLISLAAGATLEAAKLIRNTIWGTDKNVLLTVTTDDGTSTTYRIVGNKSLPDELTAIAEQ